MIKPKHSKMRGTNQYVTAESRNIGVDIAAAYCDLSLAAWTELQLFDAERTQAGTCSLEDKR